MGPADPLEHPLVPLEWPRSDPAGEDDHVRRRDLLEGGVDAQTEHAVLAAHLAPDVADEDDVEGRNALQDLVGAHGVERGEPREEGDGDLHAVGHADVLSFGAARKRRR